MGLFFNYKPFLEAEYTPKLAVPFPADEKQIWLVSGEKTQVSLSTYAHLSSLFQRRMYFLFCFKVLYSNLSEQSLSYNFPGMNLSLSEVGEKKFNEAVCKAIGFSLKKREFCFIRSDSNENKFYVTCFTAKTSIDIYKRAESYLNMIPTLPYKEDGYDNGIRFRLGLPEEPIYENEEVRALALEVEEKLSKLVMEDFPLEVIESWLQKTVKLSRLRVTSDYRIILTDYGKEIKMRQLPKALFLFFLRHADGCRVKELSDHREELLRIYWNLTNQDNPMQVKKSIDSLVDPLSNSFNEKSTAIKLAFQNEFSDRIAKNYYINGPQGGVKRITLDRSLVEWDAHF